MPRQPRLCEDRLSPKTSALHGGHRRGPLLGLVVRNLWNDLVPRYPKRPVVAQLHLLGLRLGSWPTPPHHHDLSVGEWRRQRQTLFALLCLLRRPPVHGPREAGGSHHPCGGLLGPHRCRAHHPLRCRPHETVRSSHGWRRSRPKRRRHRSTGISHPLGLAPGLGRHARPSAEVAWTRSQRSPGLSTLSQRSAGQHTQGALALQESTGPQHARLCRPASA